MHVHAAGAGDPEVASSSSFWPSGMPVSRLKPSSVDDVAAGQRAVGRDREAAHVPAVGVVDPERLLVGREAQAVGLGEVVDEQVQLAVGVDAVDAAEVELLLPLDAEARPAAVGRVGEDDRAVGARRRCRWGC